MFLFLFFPRAVFMVGLPFPNARDDRVRLKMQHEDVKSRESNACGGGGGGSAWYKTQAYRAVNQAVGRVIRGRADFGAVFFMDRRFGDPDVVGSLSKWLREQVGEGARKKSLCSRARTCLA